MTPRIPTSAEFVAYQGAHCHQLWTQVGPDWACPSCRRTKYQLLRWTTRFPNKPGAFKDWMAGLHRHHDHSVRLLTNDSPRFGTTIVCDQCNAADGTAKRKLNLPSDFSFSPAEISQFVIARPHDKHQILYRIAGDIYDAIACGAAGGLPRG